jgi:hypothetical protein
MKKTTVRLDDQGHDLLVHIAEKRQVSLYHLINYALVRFVSFEEAFETLVARARRARPGAMRTVSLTPRHTGSPRWSLRTACRQTSTGSRSKSGSRRRPPSIPGGRDADRRFTRR